MKPLAIGSASKVYGDASGCEIIRHWIDHSALAEVSHLLRALVQALGDDVTDEFWRQTLGPIRRLGFAFCAVPLPFSLVAAAVGIDLDRLRRQVHLCQQLFPDVHEALATLVGQLERLCTENNSPFIEPLESLLRQNNKLSVVLCNPKVNRSVSTYFARTAVLKRATLVSPMQLRGTHLCETLAVIGPCSWFPEYMFSAPRASAIHIISLRWIRDSWRPGPIFLHNTDSSKGQGCSHRIGPMPRFSEEAGATNQSQADIHHPGDLLPPIPTLDCNGATHTVVPPGNDAETILARVCYLSGNRAVLLAADDGASALVIDTSERGYTAVRRVSVGELETGQYLLLRTSGGGDFIIPLADRILGVSAAKYRAEQAEWKERLIAAAVERFGGQLSRQELSYRVSSEIQSQNMSQARPLNVHYWMSSKCIRPRKKEDFVAILIFAGLEARAEQLWSSMGDIDRAHRKAGHLIRQMLLQKIATTSLDLLERDGEMDFDLGDRDGGTLSAFLITAIMPEQFDVPVDRIGVLVDLEK